MEPSTPGYQALIVVSFGGPDGPEDVIPFLENVTRGRGTPRERLLEVAEHYYHFGGKSPINRQNLALIAAVKRLLAEQGPRLPVYWGNRNWHPLLADTLRQMKKDGVQRALGFVTSAYSSYSGCRQYREDIAQARQVCGPGAPEVDKLRAFFNHPGFIEPMGERVEAALAKFPPEKRDEVELIFTAHSIPMSMAATCRYVEQLIEASRLVSRRIGRGEPRLVYQSRSGPPTQPWLEPDILDCLREIGSRRPQAGVVVVPIGFISDHLEVLYDLDTEAQDLASELGLHLVRAGTAGTHPRFIRMIRELILERTEAAKAMALGNLGPSPDVCPPDCCPAPRRPPRSPASGPSAPA